MRWSLCGRPVSFPRRRRRWRFEPTSPRCAASLCCVPPRSSRSSLLLISPLLCFLYLLVKITRGLKFRVLLVLLNCDVFLQHRDRPNISPASNDAVVLFIHAKPVRFGCGFKLVTWKIALHFFEIHLQNLYLSPILENTINSQSSTL